MTPSILNHRKLLSISERRSKPRRQTSRSRWTSSKRIKSAKWWTLTLPSTITRREKLKCKKDSNEWPTLSRKSQTCNSYLKLKSLRGFTWAMTKTGSVSPRSTSSAKNNWCSLRKPKRSCWPKTTNSFRRRQSWQSFRTNSWPRSWNTSQSSASSWFMRTRKWRSKSTA